MLFFTAGLVVYKTPVSELLELFDLLAKEDNLEQVFVFDNGLDSALKNEVVKRGWYYLTAGKNIGFGAAHNRILDSLNGSIANFHWIINPDLLWHISPTQSLITYLEKYKDCAAVMPDVRNTDGSRQYLAKNLPSPTTLLGRRFFRAFASMQKRIAKYEMHEQSYSSSFRVPLISGCCMFTRTEHLNAVGGFDEQYFLYLEDYDLCRELTKAGFVLAVEPSAQVVHGHGQASYKFSKAFALHLESAIKYFNKWGWFSDVENRRRV